jgi:hypothetical protein
MESLRVWYLFFLVVVSVIDISYYAGEWNEEIYYYDVIGEGRMMEHMVVMFWRTYVNTVISTDLVESEE